MPVYLWWTRLAAAEGLSAVGHRPGIPGLALVVEGVLRVTVVESLAALEVVLGASVGLAVGALLRRGTTRASWLLGGALVGTFASHLATGWLANLMLAVALLGAARALAEGTRRGAALAAGLLAAGGLAHPLFLLLAAIILGVAAAAAFRTEPDEAALIGAAVVGGGVLAGLGLAALQVGPDPLAVDTSRDGILRRAGLQGVLRRAYLHRFVDRWPRYVQWASVPLAIIGFPRERGFLRRLLGAWALTTVAGIAAALLSGWVPADRLVTFAFVVPMLAALGLVRVARALEPRRPLAIALTGGLTLAMLAGSFFAWNRQEPFLSDLEVERLASVNRLVAASEPGTAIVFSVSGGDGAGTFLAARAGNLFRASVPPDRIRDVVVLAVATDPDAGEEGAALARLSRRDVSLAVARAEGRRLDILVAPFDRVGLEAAQRERRWTKVDTGVFARAAPPRPVPEPIDPLRSSSPSSIALTSLLALAAVSAVGYGWARVAVADALDAAAVAPAFGSAGMILAAVALDLLGAPLGGAGGPIVASALAGGSGYLALLLTERRARARPAA